jgi:Zn-dependent M28 family amino/carboxypeptidase
LQPAGDHGGYLQNVPINHATLDEDESTLSLMRNGQNVPLEYGEDYVPWPDPARSQTSVTAPVVYVGFGATAPELGHDDYATVDVRDKIVAFLWRSPPESFPHDQGAHYSSIPVKVQTAAAHGAVGVIILYTEAQEESMPWSTIVGFAEQGWLAWADDSGNAQSTQPRIQGSALLSHAGTDALFEGSGESWDEVRSATAAGEIHSVELPVEVSIRRTTEHSKVHSSNVVAVLPGSDPRLSSEYVVYTAHLDHLGVGKPVDGDDIYNGAVDNASGVAAFLEIARTFATLPHRPRRSVMFLAVTGEENGFIGSDYFVHHPTVPSGMIAAEVNLDGLLMLHPLHDVIAFGAEHSSLAKFVELAANRFELAISPDPVPEELLFIRSDQYSFVKAGIPAVSLCPGGMTGDSDVDGIELIFDWKRRYYHKPQDDMDQPLDFAAGADFTRFAFLVGYLTANETARPTWNPGDFFGETFGLPQTKR